MPPTPTPPTLTYSARARLAAISRHHSGDTEALDDARLNLRAARLEDYIRREVALAPALTDEQRGRLSAILAGNGASDG